MKETVALLVTAHLLADFLFQTTWMVQRKKNFLVFLLHLMIVAATAGMAIGHWDHSLIGIIAGSHLAIDLAKTYLLPDRLWTFLLDQGLHLVAILIGAYYFPTSAQSGFWFQLLPNPADQQVLMKAVTILGGLILCIPAGGVLIAKIVKPMVSAQSLEKMQGIPNGGRIIGYLERSLVMLLIWINQPAGIGFLVTAKSILRFGDIKDSDNRQLTEYVIIGTFLSFGWAILSTTLIQKAWELW